MGATRVGYKLWVGSVPSPYLRQVGYGAVALCAVEHQDILPDIPTIRAPIRDADLTDEEFAVAVKAAEEVSKFRRRGVEVLVTCRMGVNRSAFVAALSLMQLEKLSARQAIRQVREARGPDTWITPLSNPSFVNALRRYGGERP